MRRELAREAIVRLCASGLPTRELFEEIAARVRPVVPYVAAGWLSTDPATLLYTDAVVENVAGSLHLELFENELTTPDFGKFAGIVRQPQPVSVLSLATGGEPGLSARHRTIHRPNGFSGELRAVFATGGACWGVACLTRAEGEPDFTAADAGFVSSICEYVAHGLRTALLLRAVDEAPAEHAPGMVVLAADGSIESTSDAAERWLAELPRDTLGGGLDLPSAVHAVAIRARSAVAGDEQGVPRARVRTASGRWLVLHAACLRDRSDGRERVAVMIEPARRAEIASLVVELLPAHRARAAGHPAARQGARDRRDRPDALALAAHRPRLREDDLRQARASPAGRSSPPSSSRSTSCRRSTTGVGSSH